MYKPQQLSFANAKEALQMGVAAISLGQQIFDLSGVTQADSSSLSVLLSWQRSTSTQLTFLNTPDSIKSLAKLYGVHELLNIQ